MSNYRQRFGAWGEQQAAEYLTGKGFSILDSNVRTPYGEIDLIAWLPDAQASPTGENPALNDGTLVFVEVKARRTTRYGLPEQAVTKSKQAHLLAAIQSYAQAHPELPGAWRIDVISVQHSRAGEPILITHYENAFS